MSIFPEANGKRLYKRYQGSIDLKPDVIIIGSGMAGMSAGSALARYGKKVLILEQHYLPGGYTHMFTRKGFSWDAGTHAIGQMHKKTLPKKMLDWLTDDKVEWVSLGKNYDKLYLANGKEFDYSSDFKEYRNSLYERFPNEKEAIKKYFNYCRNTNLKCTVYFLKNLFPHSLHNLLKMPYDKMTTSIFSKTTKQVLDELGMSTDLQRILTANWGYYGNIPSESSWALHALVVWHFISGASYPKGGSKVFAQSLLEAILSRGGEVYCQAKVNNILVKDGTAIGVEMEGGEKIYANHIISATAAKVTAGKLLPEEYQKTEWAKSILKQKESPSYIELNMGFDVDISKFGADSKNHWIFADDNLELKYWNLLDKNSRPPILYISFPSIKDPSHATTGDKVRHAAECITFVEWDLFAKWEKTQYKNREEAYEKFKQEISERMIAELSRKFPEMMKHLAYFELSTPLTAEHFVNVTKGAIYGLDGTPERFTCKELTPVTPVKNLYLSGVDTLATGIVGAMNSGVMSASHVDRRLIGKLIAP